MSATPLVPPRGIRSFAQFSIPTVVKAEPATIWRVTVTAAGSAPGAVYNADALDGAAAENQVAVIPNAIGDYLIGWPCSLGIVVDPGEGQLVSVSYT